VIVIALTLIGAMLGPPVVEILIDSSYHDAAGLVPWLVLGYGFFGVYFIPMNGATLAAGRRSFVWVASGAGVVVNLGLIVLLTPRHGIEAAAIASAAGYLCLLVLMSIWAHWRPNPVTYNWPAIGGAVALAAAVYVGGSLTEQDAVVADAAVQCGWLALFGAACYRLVLRGRRA
jgi:O-antigen/teichoic acid export membrane protein